MGRRTAKHRIGDYGGAVERTLFSWDGPRLVEEHSTGANGAITTLTWDYDPGTFRPAAQRRRALAADADAEQDAYDEAFHAIITDLVGTPAELVTPDGDIAWHSSTTIWGHTTEFSVDAGLHCPRRFPGQYHDDETGLHYNLYRYYNPDTAAYLTPDPLGLDPAPNDHAYVPNPLTWIDPLGLACGEDGEGDVADGPSEDMTQVGRWMSPEEHQSMIDTGKVQAGSEGTSTYVASPADPAAYYRQAAPGTRYVEFDVPTSSLKPAGEPGWAQIPGPKHPIYAKLNAKRGLPPPEMPSFENLIWDGTVKT
ncbi:RHS repeat-associated core domain-containing protein [Catenulispora pinistramenti]|nr:RHS repeat-associated core domain-containing protein [Catenulispora pinistramenti]